VFASKQTRTALQVKLEPITIFFDQLHYDLFSSSPGLNNNNDSNNNNNNSNVAETFI
jgi:hypothetical protein